MNCQPHRQAPLAEVRRAARGGGGKRGVPHLLRSHVPTPLCVLRDFGVVLKTRLFSSFVVSRNFLKKKFPARHELIRGFNDIIMAICYSAKIKLRCKIHVRMNKTVM